MTHEPNSHGNPDLRSFHDLKATLPATKFGAVVALLPEIHSLQRRGHKARAIWECLTNKGSQMSYDLFRLYLDTVEVTDSSSVGPTMQALGF
jgi:hypothetical protein